MKRNLPGWCKTARTKMIAMDITVPELAERVNMTRQYTSAIVNGRVFSAPAVKKISDYLEISDQYDDTHPAS